MIVLQVLFIIFCIVALLILWVLLAPLVLFIDTGSGSYYVELVSLARARLSFDDNLFKIRLRILFVHFNIDPFKPSKKKKKKEERTRGGEKRPERKKRFSMRKGSRFFTEMIRSFDADVQAEIDTGNVITNAWLVPVFVFVKGEGFQVSVNNTGINFIRAKFRNRLSRLFYIFIKYRVFNR